MNATPYTHLYVRKASAGSGKTYTLAAHYIALLMHGVSYRQILAVTFTNKATAEMKERILTYLHAIAREVEKSETRDFLHRVGDIYAELGYGTLPELSQCQQKAEELYKDILSNYDRMAVTTIDTFFQQLLAGMVLTLDGAVGYSVEIDSDTVITNAVGKLLTNDAQDPTLCKHITDYMKGRMADDKNWNIRSGLIAIAKELYTELLHEKKEQVVTDSMRLEQFKKGIHQMLQKQKETDELRALLQKANEWNEKCFSRGKDIISRLENYQRTIDNTLQKKEVAFNPFTATQLNNIRDEEKFQSFYKGGDTRQAYETMNRIADIVEKLRAARLREELLTEHLNDLVLIQYLREAINSVLHENNSRLLAETACTLAQALRPGDADFILEKAGIRYQHVMIDEFQDTSTLQWENFRHLVEEILGNGGSTLIVGDVKQSIYRWRNGNWEIMQSLHGNPSIQPLVRNFRSRKEIVAFNLQLFSYLCEQEEDPRIKAIYDEGFEEKKLEQYYVNGKHDGGYVQLHFYPSAYNGEGKHQARALILSDMFRTMNKLLKQGEKASSMLILIRNRKEIEEILDAFEHLPEGEELDALKKTHIVSNDCFCLEYSQSVNLIIQALRYLHNNDAIAEEYLLQRRPDKTPEDLNPLREKNLPLNDLAEAIIQQYLIEENGETDGQEMAYLCSFKDSLKRYVGLHGSNLPDFLQYWDDKLRKSTIPSVEGNDIRIMTIHAAKGLESENLFIPFADWKMEEDKRNSKLWCEVPELQTENSQSALLPISKQKSMQEAGFDEYVQEHKMERIDNLNLLYVALTRAADRLYVYSDIDTMKDKDRKTYHVGQLIAEYTGVSDALQEAIKNKEFDNPANCQEIRYGEETLPIASSERKEKISAPFRFTQAETLEAHYHSSTSHIVFRQSGDAHKYTETVAERNLQVMDRQSFGTLCHDILATLGLFADIEKATYAVRSAVADFYRQGKIPTEGVRKEIEEILVRTVSAEEMQPWFTGEGEVWCEQAVLYPHPKSHQPEERRMDRVRVNGKKAAVLDYKFGEEEKSYYQQVKEYMYILRQMGYEQVEGKLWIANENKLQEVNA